MKRFLPYTLLYFIVTVLLSACAQQSSRVSGNATAAADSNESIIDTGQSQVNKPSSQIQPRSSSRKVLAKNSRQVKKNPSQTIKKTPSKKDNLAAGNKNSVKTIGQASSGPSLLPDIQKAKPKLSDYLRSASAPVEDESSFPVVESHTPANRYANDDSLSQSTDMVSKKWQDSDWDIPMSISIVEAERVIAEIMGNKYSKNTVFSTGSLTVRNDSDTKMTETKTTPEKKRDKNDEIFSTSMMNSLSDQQKKNLQNKNASSRMVSYIRIREGDRETLVSATRPNIQQKTLDDILALDWQRMIPTERQANDERYRYCFSVLQQLRQKHYALLLPYRIAPGDYQRWRQRLGKIALVQLTGTSLDLYRLGDTQASTYAVSTVFEMDEQLSELLPGVNAARKHFSGFLAFGGNTQQGLGGAGRFYTQQKISAISWYLLRWQSQFYALKVQGRPSVYQDLEIVPLLFSQQDSRRNCRWSL